MNKTADRATEERIAVDINGLSAMLSCGHATARKIADEANATIRINRRVLFNVEKIRKYLNGIAF